jgi:hypothetical protein
LYEKTVRRFFYDYAEVLKKSTHFAKPRMVGMDELHVIHQTRGTIINIESPKATGSE